MLTDNLFLSGDKKPRILSVVDEVIKKKKAKEGMSLKVYQLVFLDNDTFKQKNDKRGYVVILHFSQ